MDKCNMQNLCYKDPKTFGQKSKNQIINQNIFHSGYGDYRMCPYPESIHFSYKSRFNPGKIDNICEVHVLNKHPIDIADTMCNHGVESLTNRNSTPAIMYPIGDFFDGTEFDHNGGIYDENTVLRTNYAYVIKKQKKLFPIVNDGKIIYSNPVTVIRDSEYNALSFDKLFKFGVITVCPNEKNNLLRTAGGNVLGSTDLLKFHMLIEAVFQAAFCGFHEILILTFFFSEFNISIDDQLLIFNHCIMKYGQKFKSIIISIPPYKDKQIFDYFDKNIIKPQEFTKSIDMKYSDILMSRRISEYIDANTETVSD